MTDRELLQLACKAAFSRANLSEDRDLQKHWNPLTDDGDALRLAVALGISITPYPIYQPEKHSVVTKQRRPSDTLRKSNPTETIVPYDDDPLLATRRAIVRAAAEMGKENTE